MSNERLDRLEERLAWFERHLTEQDKAMLELHAENLRLQRALVDLRSHLAASGGEGMAMPAAAEMPPPHYRTEFTICDLRMTIDGPRSLPAAEIRDRN
jgi:SlyX protein